MKTSNFSIISGKYKGLKINGKLSNNIRPTSSKVRKAIFDAIPNIHNYLVLDLFSGSGMLGFEALSRGASSITFVERELNEIKFIKKNSLKFKNEKIKIIKANVLNYIKKNKLLYDLIIADPPYGKIDLNEFFMNIKNNLIDGGNLILECSIKENQIKNYEKIKKYGDTQIITLKK